MEWLPIATAPKDGSIVYIRDEIGVFCCAMFWDKEHARWEGMAFGVLGPSRTYWDESFVKVHEWRPLQPPNAELCGAARRPHE